ncbi:tetratricopeptide repeat protein [Zeaxanthinibacter enoshimensis]|uniref:Tetratricopeptide repeat protein n=1 Tax=Zeaxanthinibacter enoshimensis TaxID=392009 RepID=A0A4R6TGN4_9FLAO|nr:hypothetical protein [Zeaxanthinibacter enoshimensis]TDQ29407.1 hypothetical protein CLV82_2865 [Zeaxanthinibacter enoshimensis]
MKNLLLSAMVLFLLASCTSEQKETITNPADYESFLGSAPAPTTSKYFELWNSKIKPDSLQLMSFGIVAQQYDKYFKETGDITYLKKAEQALEKAVEIAHVGRSGYYRALARNYISQHRFKEALQLAGKARAEGSGVRESQSLLFDIHMELGNYERAEVYLDSIKNMSDYGYLIRLAKWNDYKGDLDTTIRLMEQAAAKAEDAKNVSLMEWSYTNLADYYGHAGRISDSYTYYLKSLNLNPGSSYAKKGIAWIVFSYEKDAEEAMRILDSVTRTHQSPDYFLLKSEIANYMDDRQKQLKNLEKYMSLVRNDAYGEMYNAYNIKLYLDETDEIAEALDIARREVNNRPTPETYGLLAYAHLKAGEEKIARRIVEDHVKGKTFEPGILLQTAAIYKANGQEEEVRTLKEELLEATYELGPVTEQEIRRL